MIVSTKMATRGKDWIRSEVHLPYGTVRVLMGSDRPEVRELSVVQEGIRLDTLLGDPFRFHGGAKDIWPLVREQLEDLHAQIAAKHVTPFTTDSVPGVDIHRLPPLCGDFFAAVEHCTSCLVAQDLALEQGLLVFREATFETGPHWLQWADGIIRGGRVEQRSDGTWDWQRRRPDMRDENIYSAHGGAGTTHHTFTVPPGQTIPVLRGPTRLTKPERRQRKAAKKHAKQKCRSTKKQKRT